MQGRFLRQSAAAAQAQQQKVDQQSQAEAGAEGTVPSLRLKHFLRATSSRLESAQVVSLVGQMAVRHISRTKQVPLSCKRTAARPPRTRPAAQVAIHRAPSVQLFSQVVQEVMVLAELEPVKAGEVVVQRVPTAQVAQVEQILQ